MSKINWGIDWSEGSTLRGVIWVVGGITAFVTLLVTDSVEKAGFVMTLTGTIAGGLGIGVKSGDGR